jgi:hypothetical protein
LTGIPVTKLNVEMAAPLATAVGTRHRTLKRVPSTAPTRIPRIIIMRAIPCGARIPADLLRTD